MEVGVETYTNPGEQERSGKKSTQIIGRFTVTTIESSNNYTELSTILFSEGGTVE